MTRVGTVGSLWRFPAKSMGGDTFPTLRLGDGGVVGDRAWAVRDEVRGGIRGAKKLGGLLRLHARYVTEPSEGAAPPPIEVSTPDGRCMRSDDAGIDEFLSTFLDHPVTLWPLQPTADHYRRGAPDHEDFETELRSIFGREPDEPLPDFAGLPLDVLMEYESPPGTYFDAFPILVVSTRTLDHLASLTPGSAFDVRRFRPNVVLALDDTVAGDLPESDWLGRRLVLGDVELELAAACPRCVMVTREQADLPPDRAVLRTIVRHAAQNVGVYANVVRPGVLDVGADVELR